MIEGDFIHAEKPIPSRPWVTRAQSRLLPRPEIMVRLETLKIVSSLKAGFHYPDLMRTPAVRYGFSGLWENFNLGRLSNFNILCYNLCEFSIDFGNPVMGGYNSGGGRDAMRQRQFWDLDIAILRRFDMLRPGFSKSLIWSINGEEQARIWVECHRDHLILDYRTRKRGGEWELIRDRIPLTYTFPNYGGRRAWLVCPSCEGRKRVLWGRTYYRCARCWGMTYDSQYEDRASRLLERAQRIKIKLGGEASCIVPFPPKPKGMHWRTYNAHRSEFDDVYHRANLEAHARFGQFLLG